MKIGILTMFYKSSNYGGILQAYALTKAIASLGVDAEQICYKHYTAWSIKRRIKTFIKKHLPLIQNPLLIGLQFKIWRRTNKVISASSLLVPHSTTIYSEQRIKKSLKVYTDFITGSDQVWYGDWPGFFLSFVPKGYKKIAYAASTGKTTLSVKDIEKIKKNVMDFDFISVREKEMQKQLTDFLDGKKVELVLDPTLLLDIQDWNEIASGILCSTPYLFCYYLGNDERMRVLAEQYGKKYGLRVITIPHMQGKIENVDLQFGEDQIFEATPQDFLSYIKNADMVFTDSFHASVFSQIFKTQYIVFGRTDHKEMNSRLQTLTNLFNTKHRFICNEGDYNLIYIEKTNRIDFQENHDELLYLKAASYDYLKKSLIKK